MHSIQEVAKMTGLTSRALRLYEEVGILSLKTVEELAPFAFSKAHIVGHGRLVKCCAILKSLHRDVYLAEASRWEDEHGLSWSDFGFRDNNVCLLK